MSASSLAGIIFANNNDNALKRLTSHMSMASVPYGARYRFIDFSLSNLVNAGVNTVGIITKENYRSLMEHVGNGSYWELDRRSGGLFMLPPYLTSNVKRYNGTVDALYGALDFIKHCSADCMVICNSDIVANIDIASAVAFHNEKKADITMVCCSDENINEKRENTFFTLTDSGKVKKLEFSDKKIKADAIGTGVTIIGRELLIKLVTEANDGDYTDLLKDYLPQKLSSLKVYGYSHNDYIRFMGGTDMFYQANMDMLDKNVRKSLFNPERPVFTKARDDVPTRYGTKANVTNCIVADGCVIDGTVKNSIIFRGVKVEKGAVIENSILMQSATVGKDAGLYNVISDENAVIGEGMVLKGSKDKHFFIKRNQVI